MNYDMDRVSIRMVKEPPLLSEKPITGPESAIEILNDYLGDFDREVMAIVNLRTDGKPINMNIMSMGTINASLACPREALKASICRMLQRCCCFTITRQGISGLREKISDLWIS